MSQFKFDQAPTRTVRAEDLNVGDVIADYYTTWEVLSVRRNEAAKRMTLTVKPSNPEYETVLFLPYDSHHKIYS
jgi:hypothetical protein